MQPTLDQLHLTEIFLGVSILAVIPSTVCAFLCVFLFLSLSFIHLLHPQAEYVNAVQFALQNNVALSVEIGSSGAIQIALIQMPVLVLMSLILNHGYCYFFFFFFFCTIIIAVIAEDRITSLLLVLFFVLTVTELQQEASPSFSPCWTAAQ
jgi:Ca2+/H+ antiporter